MYDCVSGQSELAISPDMVSIIDVWLCIRSVRTGDFTRYVLYNSDMYDCVPGRSELVISPDMVCIILICIMCTRSVRTGDFTRYGLYNWCMIVSQVSQNWWSHQIWSLWLMYDCVSGQSELVISPDMVSIIDVWLSIRSVKTGDFTRYVLYNSDMYDCVPGRWELVISPDMVCIILICIMCTRSVRTGDFTRSGLYNWCMIVYQVSQNWWFHQIWSL